MGRQFVVQLENRPGELAHLAHAFAQRGINIHHVACVGAGPLACMFVTTGNDDEARSVLQGLGHQFIEGQPIMVEIPDEPGGLAEVSQKLAAAGVNITGMLPSGRRGNLVEMTFCVDDEAKAREALGLDAVQLVGCTE